MKEGGNPLKTPSVMRMGPPNHQSQQTAEEKNTRNTYIFSKCREENK